MSDEFSAELLKRGRRLVTSESKSKWALGDLALEIVPMGERGKNTEALARVRRFANEIGLQPTSLQQYRRIAATWPDETRVLSVPWSIHRLLAGRDDRAEVIGKCEGLKYSQVLDRFPSAAAPGKTEAERAARRIASVRVFLEKKLPDPMAIEGELRKLYDLLGSLLPEKG